jgi:hypothetical protein
VLVQKQFLVLGANITKKQLMRPHHMPCELIFCFELSFSACFFAVLATERQQCCGSVKRFLSGASYVVFLNPELVSNRRVVPHVAII